MQNLTCKNISWTILDNAYRGRHVVIAKLKCIKTGKNM